MYYHRPAIRIIREYRVNIRYSLQHDPPDARHTRVLLNPGVPGRFQGYFPIEQGQLIVPSQHQVHFFFAQQKTLSKPSDADTR
jgi:hypothetical protein